MLVKNFSGENETLYSLDEDEYNFSVLHALKALVLILIIIVAIFSNLLVIFSVVLYRKLRGINNYFLVSLAFADLIVACFAMTLNATQEILGRWIFGPAVCDLWNSIDVHASTVSTLHLCAISFDRFYAIVKPFDYDHFMNTYSAMGMIVAAWFCPVFISFVPIFMGWYTTKEHLKEREETEDKVCKFVTNVPYALFSSTLTFWFPVILMVLVYYRVYREAMKQKKSMEKMTNIRALPVAKNSLNSFSGDMSRADTLSTNNGSGSGVLYKNNSESTAEKEAQVRPDKCDSVSTTNGGDDAKSKAAKRISLEAAILDARSKARNSVFASSGTNILEVLKERRRLNSSWRREHKAFVTLGVVMGTFLLCWLPFFIWYLTTTICGDACYCPDEVVSLLFWIGYFNSTLNPVIYAMTNRDFKLAFIGILKRIFCCQCTEESRRNSDNF